MRIQAQARLALMSISMTLAVGLATAAAAQPLATPGAVAVVPVPRGWQGQYVEKWDAVVIGRPQHTEALVTVGPPVEPAAILRAMLTQMGAAEYAGRVEPLRLGGVEGASMRAEVGGVRHWLIALPRDGVVLVVRAQSHGSFEELEPALRDVVLNSRIAAAEYPPLVVGHYQIGSQSSVDSSGGLYARDFVTLHADGAVETSGSVSGTVGGVSALGQGRGAAGRWEVRGNRLLVWDGGEGFTNYLVKAFRNGLELQAGDNRPVLAVRQ